MKRICFLICYFFLTVQNKSPLPVINYRRRTIIMRRDVLFQLSRGRVNRVF